MRNEDLAGLFHEDYVADRTAFEHAVRAFAERTQRSLELHRRWLDGEASSCITVAEFPARSPERALVLVTGTHGVEGYAGSAIARYLLSQQLLATDAEHTAIVIVHALNPYGFAHFTRVNRDNVDLNRNCALRGEPLFSADSSAYAALASVLSPKRPVRAGRLPQARFYAQLLAARARRGERVVREASLGGQYVDPRGVFWGGDRVQPEIRFFQGIYDRLAERYRELLVVDLHTGYGVRGEAYALFGCTDSPAIEACSVQGVSDGQGHDRTYTVRGDLVGYCYQTAKRSMPHGTYNGVALELGTHGLGLATQLADLYTVVLENQLRQHKSDDPRLAEQIRAAFRELFYPSAPAWRTRAVSVGSRAVEGLLRARGFLRRS